jgi:hypothetical protein
MERRNDEFDDRNDACDLDALLHPSQAFEHPSDVVNDPDLTLNEKRAILASWASDACAVEAVPSLRCLPGAKRPVCFDDVMDALRALDQEARERGGRIPRYPRVGRPVRNGGTPDKGQGHAAR